MTNTTMGAKTEITCKCGCGRKKMVRDADIKRGWGLYHSKSCKARRQWSDGGGGRKTNYNTLCNAFENGRVSEEYFIHCVRNQYSSKELECEKKYDLDFYHTVDIHPFSEEAFED